MQLSVSPLKLSTHLETVMFIKYSGEQEPIQHFSMLKMFLEPLWLAAIHLIWKDKSNIISHTAVNIIIDYLLNIS